MMSSSIQAKDVAWLKGAPLMDTSYIAGGHPQLHKGDAWRSPKPPKAAVVSNGVLASGQVAIMNSPFVKLYTSGNTSDLASSPY